MLRGEHLTCSVTAAIHASRTCLSLSPAFAFVRPTQAVQWDGGVGVHDLVRSRLSWVSQLPTSLLAASARSCRLAVGTPTGSVVLLDAEGRASSGQGVLHGLGVQAAEFYSVPHLAPGEVSPLRCWWARNGVPDALLGVMGWLCRMVCHV